jgi:hypothetical protein
VDVGVERPGVGEVGIRPQQVDQFVARPHPLGRVEEGGQQVELLAGQVDRSAVDGHLAAHVVDGHVPERLQRPAAGTVRPPTDRCRMAGFRTGVTDGHRLPEGHPAEDGVHAGDELAQAERLGHVARGPEFEAEDDVELGVDRADHQDGDVRHGPQLPADIDPVHARKQHVEQDDIGVVLGEQTEAFGAVGGQDHVEAFVAETGGEGLAVGLLVLDDQDLDAVALHEHRRLLLLPR